MSCERVLCTKMLNTTPLLTAKLFDGAIAGYRQRASLGGTNRSGVGCWASTLLNKWGLFSFRPWEQYGQAVEWCRNVEDNQILRHQSSSVSCDRQKFGCDRRTAKPLLVIARNRVFLCILHCCMAMGWLFVAFLEARSGNCPPKVAREVHKIMYWNRCRLQLVPHNAPFGEHAHTLFGAREQIAPLLAYAKEDPRGKWLWVCEHCHALCTRRTMGLVLGVGVRIRVQWNKKQWLSSRFGDGGF